MVSFRANFSYSLPRDIIRMRLTMAPDMEAMIWRAGNPIDITPKIIT